MVPRQSQRFPSGRSLFGAKHARAPTTPTGRSLPGESGTRYGLIAAFVRAGHFQRSSGLPLDAFPSRRRWPSVSSPAGSTASSGRQKPSDHAPLLAELRD
jgi:hypothetical protein